MAHLAGCAEQRLERLGSLGLPMWTWTVENSGRVTIYSVVRLLDFSPFEYGNTITGGKVYVPVSVISGLETKRSIIFDDVATYPETVQVTEVQQIDTNGDGEPDHWEISFTPDLNRTLDTSTATLYGNVANSTHGQTISGEVLGDGDTSQTFQSFHLQKSPVTFVHKAGAPHGVADTLQIQIGGVYWNEVQNLFGRGPKERVFMTTEDANGIIVQFGDGVTGSRSPTGRGNVVATYRQGIGLAGNVSAGALRTLLDRPVGLKSVRNPAAASAGARSRSLDQSRANAPNTVRTFGRIVSLEDFEYAARELAGSPRLTPRGSGMARRRSSTSPSQVRVAQPSWARPTTNSSPTSTAGVIQIALCKCERTHRFPSNYRQPSSSVQIT